MKIQIKNRWTGLLIIEGDFSSLAAFVIVCASKRINLSGANLRGANLRGANLRGAKNAELVIARTRILPEGELVGWKKCKSNIIVKLSIPTEAKMSHSFGRKCRAEFVKVLEIIGAEAAVSSHDGKTVYRVGEIVRPDKWDDNFQNEYASGIHFFITRLEAENCI